MNLSVTKKRPIDDLDSVRWKDVHHITIEWWCFLFGLEENNHELSKLSAIRFDHPHSPLPLTLT